MRIDRFLRTFLAGTLVAGLAALAGNLRAGLPLRIAIPGAVGFGLFTGFFSAVSLEMFRYALARKSQTVERLLDGDARRGVNAREQLILPLPPEQALELCRTVVRRTPGPQGVRVKGSTVHAHAGMAWVGTGQRIEVRVTPAEGGSQVEITSRPSSRLVMVDYGRNRKMVERIRAALLDHAAVPALSAGADARLVPNSRKQHV